MTQTLHLINATQLHAQVTSDASRAAKLAASPLSAEQIVEEIYLLVYSRFPDAEEREIGKQIFAEAGSAKRATSLTLTVVLLPEDEAALAIVDAIQLAALAPGQVAVGERAVGHRVGVLLVVLDAVELPVGERTVGGAVLDPGVVAVVAQLEPVAGIG